MPGLNELVAIDVHSHIVPEKFPAYIGSGKDIPWPSMAPAHACHCHVIINGKNYRTVHQACWMPDERVQHMDRNRIGVQCLSPMPELLSYWLPANDAQVLIRYINDEIAKMVVRHPARFTGLGAVPLQDMDLALRELEYVVNELKFPGVEIASHVNGTSIGDAKFEPFFAAAEKTGAAIFVHALRPVGLERMVGVATEQTICFPGEIGLAVAAMITGGMAERHPKLRIAFSHGGGVFSILLGRLTNAWMKQAKLKETLPQSPRVYARRFYYDTIVNDPASLRHVVHTFGGSQVLVGSDYPFMGDDDPVGSVNGADLDEATVRAIMRGNAENFLERTFA
ncbi:MAG: amidohydrolase [Betaproteobacteria bacterium]|nr:amidohydrolase [Betaproteobacteria bacterium]